MRYGIVINLDYENHPYKTVREVYQAVEEKMAAVGFRKDGRLFTIDLDGPAACELARHAINELAESLAVPGGDMFLYLKEFYGFDLSKATNLLLPSSEDIGVLELEDLEEVEIVQLIGSER